MKLIVLNFFTCCFCVHLAHAQSSQFSSFLVSPMAMNPAFTGGGTCSYGAEGRAIANYQMAMTGLPLSCTHFQLSADQHLFRLGGGLGFSYFRYVSSFDQRKLDGLSAAYSYLLPLSRGKIFMRLGLQPYVVKLTGSYPGDFSVNQLLVGNWSTDKMLQSRESEKKSVGGMNLGWSMCTSQYTIGFAVHNIVGHRNQETIQSSALNRTFSATGGYKIWIKGRFSTTHIIPLASYIWQRNQQIFSSGLLLNRRPLILGIWYKNNHGIRGNYREFSLQTGYSKHAIKINYCINYLPVKNGFGFISGHELSVFLLRCVPPAFKVFRPLHCQELGD